MSRDEIDALKQEIERLLSMTSARESRIESLIEELEWRDQFLGEKDLLEQYGRWDAAKRRKEALV